MKRDYLYAKTAEVKSEIQAALQLVYDTLNKGQQKKIVKEDAVKELFDRYGVQYEE